PPVVQAKKTSVSSQVTEVQPVPVAQPQNVTPSIVEKPPVITPVQEPIFPAKTIIIENVITEQDVSAAPLSSPSTPSIRNEQTERSYTETQLGEMRRQIELLSQALEVEKKAREEIKQNQVQQSIAQFRGALEKMWVNGAPAEAMQNEMRTLARSLAIPENVERTILREVKIEMYGRAVKEVLAKRQLLRSSSSTLEWLRKVYHIAIEEYLEYESKFLLDLVSNQFNGTIFQISSDEKTKTDITPRLKAMGYAVVTSQSPEDALEKIEKINPNIIICESHFGSGNLSGIRFLHILRSNSKFNFIPFILLTGDEDFALLQTAELRPNEGFVKKPLNIDELTSLMNQKLTWFRGYVSSLG
ncbi:MAG: response regulator, partial [Bacteroidota bacterium]|nr:response regulator [Bacteroidota bacterium]